MSKIFSEAKKEKEDLINKLFEERNINDDINFDYFTLIINFKRIKERYSIITINSRYIFI